MNQADAWGDFWASNSAGGGNGGCLPEGWQGIDSVQQDAWKAFAKRFPKTARVLDLATGDGRVMRWLLSARRDLKLVGTDLAPRLPEPPRGTKVKTGVAMENLPFKDGHFSAIVSQFGFEYGKIEKSAAELRRVLREGGLVGLLMHRGDGPILAHNRTRAEQIRWILNERRLADDAKAFLARRQSGLLAVPQSLQDAPAEGSQKFGQGSVAWEIAEAIRRSLVMGQRDSVANVAGLIDTIVGQARNELGRIDSLATACATADDEDMLSSAFDDAGLSMVSNEPLSDGRYDTPFANFRVLRPKK